MKKPLVLFVIINIHCQFLKAVWRIAILDSFAKNKQQMQDAATAMTALKQQIHAHCLQLIYEKKQRLEQELSGLAESAANETKRTAGDKHETALAMLQAEQARTSQQLAAVNEQKKLLERLNPSLKTSAVVNGSLLNTSQGYIFISVAIGKITVAGVQVLVISLQSPLGNMLAGGKNSFTLNTINYIVQSIA